MERTDADVDGFLASMPGDARDTMIELDSLIGSCLPGRSRTAWEGRFWGGTDQRIVGYGEIVQPRPRGEPVEWFLVGLARQSKHYSLYVNAVEDGAYLLASFADRLGKAKVGSASIGFRSLADVDLDELRTLLVRAHELTPADRRAS